MKGVYDKFDETAGYIFYSRYYDQKGNDVSITDSYITAKLMVRDGDLANMKDGQYLKYWIEFASFKPTSNLGNSADNQSLENVPSGEDTNLSLEDMAVLIESAASSSYQHLTVEAKDNVITMNVWQDGLAKAVLTIKESGGDSSNASWSTAREGLIALAEAACNLLDEHGHSDAIFSLNVLNDEDLSKVLLAIVGSEVILDVMDQ